MARERGLSITPRGAGTGLVGGALNSGIILDMCHMNKIRAYRDSVSVQAGVSLGALNQTLSRSGHFLGPNPSVGPYCRIGGMIGNNASGSRSLKYGSTLDNLLEVTFVDGRGNIVTLPNNQKYSRQIYDICNRVSLSSYPCTSKNSCGYRLDAVGSERETHRVLAASEGTLGIIVSARLRTLPIPPYRVLVVLRYADEKDAIRDCDAIIECDPASLEVVGPGILDGCQCFLFAEFEYNRWDSAIGAHIRNHVVDIATGDRAQAWWDKRNSSLSLSMRSVGNRPSMVEDAAVPLDKLPKLFESMAHMGSQLGAKVYYYGHAGNGNIHLRVGADAHGEAATQYLMSVVSMNGTITAEHGDGIARTPLIQYQYGEKNYSLFVELKNLLDPYNLLNPGKIVDHMRSGL